LYNFFMRKIFILFFLFPLVSSGFTQQNEVKFFHPLYICELPNINDYNIFANSGWDGNWYIGYNVCWIEKIVLPEGIERENFSKAFIGAKIGRAKTRPVQGRPIWEKEPIPGLIYIAVSSTSAWKSSSRHFLVSTEDIPLEGDPENALEGVGEARWFWAEVPIKDINFEGPNFVALWSPTTSFISREVAPILCGGWGSRERQPEPNTFLNNEIQGSPPIDPENSLKTPISVFEPAIAIKLVPKGSEQNIYIEILEVKEGKKGTGNKTIVSLVSGNNIEKAWIEVATSTTSYKKIGRYVYSPPYIFTLNPEVLPKGKIFVRVGAEDIFGNRGFSLPLEMAVELSPTDVPVEKGKK